MQNRFALHGREEGFAAMTRRQRFHIVRAQVVEERCSIVASDFDQRAWRQLCKHRPALQQRVVVEIGLIQFSTLSSSEMETC